MASVRARARLVAAVLTAAAARGTSSPRRVFVGGAAAGAALGGTALAVGKRAIDGPPPFNPPRGSLAGATILVTGASAGLGKETAVRLAAAGATVVLGARSRARGDAALAEVRARSGAADASVLELDLADLRSVRAAAAAFARRFGRLDVLVNNAGVMAIPTLQLTADGFEKQLGINHLGHFALTALLLPELLASAAPGGARVVTVASAAHLLAPASAVRAPLAVPATGEYDPWRAYARSKLANVLFAAELERRSVSASAPLTSLALHPGVVRTDLGRYLLGAAADGTGEAMPATPGAARALGLRALELLTRSVERGASTQVWLAAGAQGARGGGYYEDMHEGVRSVAAESAELAAELWAESERLTGVSFASLGPRTL